MSFGSEIASEAGRQTFRILLRIVAVVAVVAWLAGFMLGKCS